MFKLINNSGYAGDSYTMGIFSTREKAEEYRDAFIANEAEKSTRKRGYAPDLYFTIREIEIDPIYVHVDYMAQDMGAYRNQFDYAFRNGDVHYILQLRKEWESDYGGDNPWPFGDELPVVAKPDLSDLADWEKELLGITEEEGE
jgi:hypothetical protein